MQEAIRLAVESARSGHGGPIGAVIVRGETIIGRGANQVTATDDPTVEIRCRAILFEQDRTG